MAIAAAELKGIQYLSRPGVQCMPDSMACKIKLVLLMSTTTEANSTTSLKPQQGDHAAVSKPATIM